MNEGLTLYLAALAVFVGTGTIILNYILRKREERRAMCKAARRAEALQSMGQQAEESIRRTLEENARRTDEYEYASAPADWNVTYTFTPWTNSPQALIEPNPEAGQAPSLVGTDHPAKAVPPKPARHLVFPKEGSKS